MSGCRALCCFVLILGALVACSEAEQQAGTTSSAKPATHTDRKVIQAPKILDSFEVGKNVYVRSLAVERNPHSLWVGTSAGVLEIDLRNGEMRNTFTRKHGLANEYVFAIGIDSRGYKWFGTNAGGVSRYRNGEWRVFFPMHGLADYWIYAFAEQKNGDFWIGTWAGVNKVDLKTLAFTTYVKELINEWVYGIAVDSKDRVWFGTEGGVSMFNGQRWRHWTHEDGLGAPNVKALPHSANTGLGTRSRHDLSVLVQGGETYNPNYVFTVHVGPDDAVWAGTWGGGVARYNGKAWSNYTTEDGLAGNIVYSIAQDESGALWFGTNHGLSRFDGHSWHSFGRASGLLGNDVYAIATASNSDVWAGTKGGVVRLGYR
jgi:ligand-binding sensor domain-containing protein